MNRITATLSKYGSSVGAASDPYGKKARERKGHSKAIGAVARHLAEASFCVLQGQQPYRDPALAGGLCQGDVSAMAS